MSVLDLGLMIPAAATLAAVGVILVSGPHEDRDKLRSQLRWRR